MEYPKKADMIPFMGKKCRFIGTELVRHYLKKQIKSGDPMFSDLLGYREDVPVRWKSANYTPKIGFTVGWIVGFGFCFDGTIIKDSSDEYKHFKSSKMIHFVRVRLTPSGRERKVLAKNIRKVYD
jgi:hypothetical protein